MPRLSIGSSTLFAIVSSLVLLSGQAAAQTPAFDVIVSSGSGTPNGLTIPSPTIMPGDNAGNIFRFSGQTGEFLGFFATEFDNGLLDPRDLVVTGPLLEGNTTLLVNTADFNNPAAPPTDGVIDVDGVFQFDQQGNFLGQFADFMTDPATGGPVSPGGGVFGPTTDPNDDPTAQSYFIGSRAQGDILELNPQTGAIVGPVNGTQDIDFPRGFVFTPDGTLFLGSGSNPATGGGDDAILQIDPVTGTSSVFFSAATTGIPFSPLDVILNATGDAIITTSESPFSPGVATDSDVLIIPLDFNDPSDVIVLNPGLDANDEPILVDPRGLGVGPDGLLYVSSAGNDSILRFNATTGEFIDVFATAPQLNGQALTFIPAIPEPSSLLLAVMGLVGVAAMRRSR